VPHLSVGTLRNARMAEILKYNEEDLAATWAVFEWLRRNLLG
jgi:predicted RecB family nuclease